MTTMMYRRNTTSTRPKRDSAIAGSTARGMLLALIVGLQPVPGQAAEEEIAPQTDAPGVSVTDSGNRVIYSPEYFSQYNVITASDQLERIPGIQNIVGGGGRGGGGRGFGSSGDQVLINGRRVSGKSNDIDSVLDRVQARQVVRIEVIRGTVAGLDVRSQGRVVNVVLNEALTTGYGAWEASSEINSEGRLSSGGTLNYNGDLGALSYLFSLEADSRKNDSENTDLFFTPANVAFERQVENSETDSDDYAFTTNTTYTLVNGDIFNLNGLYEYEDETGNEELHRFAINNGQETFDEDFLIDEQENSREWEIGGDYEHAFAGGTVLTGRFLYTSSTSDEESAFSLRPAGGMTTLQEIQAESSHSTEKIARATYQWSLGNAHSFESGGEIAINAVEEDRQLFENVNGTLQQVSLFNQESTIEETRYQGFTTYTWQARQNLLMESSVDLEYSEIHQQGRDIDRTRDFFFAKPRVVLRYDLTELTQLRTRIERTVDQLNFGSFVASFTNDNNRFDVISAGNPELVPEKTWDYELTYERRLAGDLGIVTLRGTYSDVEDKTGRIPLVVVDQSGNQVERTASGNIGDGHSAEIRLSGSLRLDPVNVPGGVVEGFIQVQDSEITDPFTGEERDFNFFNAPYFWSLSFRQDLAWNNLSYGVETFVQGDVNKSFGRDYTQARNPGSDLELFAEMQPVENLTFRIDVQNLLRREETRRRLQYDGNRADDMLERIEFRNERPTREITFSIQGVF